MTKKVRSKVKRKGKEGQDAGVYEGAGEEEKER